jgi:hypothetical protein
MFRDAMKVTLGKIDGDFSPRIPITVGGLRFQQADEFDRFSGCDGFAETCNCIRSFAIVQPVSGKFLLGFQFLTDQLAHNL